MILWCKSGFGMNIVSSYWPTDPKTLLVIELQSSWSSKTDKWFWKITLHHTVVTFFWRDAQFTCYVCLIGYIFSNFIERAASLTMAKDRMIASWFKLNDCIAAFKATSLYKPTAHKWHEVTVINWHRHTLGKIPHSVSFLWYYWIIINKWWLSWHCRQVEKWNWVY